MTSYLLLLGFALLASLGSCSQDAPEVVYVSKSSEGANSPYSVVYNPLEGVINFRDGNANEGSCRVQGEGLYPSLSCKCLRGQCGVLLYDGYSFLDSHNRDFQKVIFRKGVALVFYDRTDLNMLPKLKEALPTILSIETHLPYFPLRKKADKLPLRNGRVSTADFELFHQADEALQVSLGGSLDTPRCYLAFIDPPTSAHEVDQQHTSALPLRTTSDSANVVYMSEHPPAPESLRLNYQPQQKTLTVEYDQDGEAVSTTISIGFLGGKLRIHAKNRLVTGLIVLDGKERDYSGNKAIDGRRNVIIVYHHQSQNARTTAKYRIAHDVEEVLNASGFFDTWELDVDTFKRFDAAVQRIIARHNPLHPRGYLVIIDPCPPLSVTQSVTNSPAGVQGRISSSGSSESSASARTANVPSIRTGSKSEVTGAEDSDSTSLLPGQHYAAPKASHAPSAVDQRQDQQLGNAANEKILEHAVANVRDRVTMSIYDNSRILLRSKSDPEDFVEVRVGASAVAVMGTRARGGQGKAKTFYPRQDVNPLGASSSTSSSPVVFALLWFGEHFPPAHLEPFRHMNPEISSQQMQDLVTAFIKKNGVSCPLVLIKIPRPSKKILLDACCMM